MSPGRLTSYLLPLLALALAATGTLASEPLRWASGPGAGELAWSAWYDGEELPGRFERFEVLLETDASGAPVSLLVEVEIGSANMNDREINAEIAEPEWFDTAAFPRARYESRDIHPEEGGYRAHGTLQLKGLARALELPLQWHEAAGQLTGAIRMSRREWEIGSGDWSDDASLSDRVELRWRVPMSPAR